MHVWVLRGHVWVACVGVEVARVGLQVLKWRVWMLAVLPLPSDRVVSALPRYIYLLQTKKECFERLALIDSCVVDHIPDQYYLGLLQLYHAALLEKQRADSLP